MNIIQKNISQELKERLIKIVQKDPAEGILFSGGLDSAILACIKKNMEAITVTLQAYGTDLQYAKRISESNNIKHHHEEVTVTEALRAIPELIKILESFDPAIPNDLAVYFGLKHAERLGLKSIMTGDGSDEILGGYSFMESIDDLDGYIKRISPFMEFNSNRICRHFGLTIYQPFLEKSFLDFALSIDHKLKIRKEKGNIWGKWILRSAFSDMLSAKFAWQTKRPLEEGSGMNHLRAIITSMVSDKEYTEKRDIYGIQFLNKEHLYYYEIFLKEVGAIPSAQDGEKLCRGCGAGIKREKFHCRVCGYVENII